LLIAVEEVGSIIKEFRKRKPEESEESEK